jgi:hypothetical protein
MFGGLPGLSWLECSCVDEARTWNRQATAQSGTLSEIGSDYCLRQTLGAKIYSNAARMHRQPGGLEENSSTWQAGLTNRVNLPADLPPVKRKKCRLALTPHYPKELCRVKRTPTPETSVASSGNGCFSVQKVVE